MDNTPGTQPDEPMPSGPAPVSSVLPPPTPLSARRFLCVRDRRGSPSLPARISNLRKRKLPICNGLPMRCARKSSAAAASVGLTSKSRPSDGVWRCTTTCWIRRRIWRHAKPRSPGRRAFAARYRPPITPCFHLLVADGAKQLSPTKPAGLRLLIQRAFNHGEMRNVCKGFAEGYTAAVKNQQPGQPSPATRQLLTLPLGPTLFAAIRAFVDLQEARIEADYNLDKQWSRLECTSPVSRPHAKPSRIGQRSASLRMQRSS